MGFVDGAVKRKAVSGRGPQGAGGAGLGQASSRRAGTGSQRGGRRGGPQKDQLTKHGTQQVFREHGTNFTRRSSLY